MTFDKSIYTLVATADTHNDLIILRFDEYSLLAIGIDALLFTDKEQTSLAVQLIVVDVFCKFLVNWIVSDCNVHKIHPLQIIHVLVYAL
jgi:hypothetical protein